MSDLESALRAELDDLDKCAKRRYNDYGNFAPDDNRTPLMATACGYRNAVWDIMRWLDSRPDDLPESLRDPQATLERGRELLKGMSVDDGWHSLIENPEDLPGHNGIFFVITASKAMPRAPTGLSRLRLARHRPSKLRLDGGKQRGRWVSLDSSSYLDCIAWKMVDYPAIPASLKSKEKV